MLLSKLVSEPSAMAAAFTMRSVVQPLRKHLYAIRSLTNEDAAPGSTSGHPENLPNLTRIKHVRSAAEFWLVAARPSGRFPTGDRYSLVLTRYLYRSMNRTLAGCYGIENDHALAAYITSNTTCDRMVL